jgi:hypothetical protein
MKSGALRHDHRCYYDSTYRGTAGVLILLIPRLSNVIVAIYLILIGIVGLWLGLHLTR